MSRAVRLPAIRLRGVRQNNLKNLDLDLPLRKLTVITGLSGSGKSSLAFDTLFAEGQRRYIETFSPYARQFFDRMDKPKADRIEGIPPAIAIEQTNSVRTTRSTIGTMTEICDYMKIAWPQLARLHCKGCGKPVRRDTPALIWAELNASAAAESKTDVVLTFDLPLTENLSLQECLELVARQGYQRLLLDGESVRIEEIGERLETPRPQFLTVIQDRFRISPSARARFVEACEQAYHFGKGRLKVWRWATGNGNGQTTVPRAFSQGFHCAECDLDYREPTPALFSFNNPVGACPTCRGFGRIITIDYQLAIPDRSKTLREGAVRPWQTGVSADCQKDLAKFCRTRSVPMNVPFDKLSPLHQEWVIQGEPDYGKDEEHEWPRAWYGVKGYFRWLESKAYKMHVRVLLSRYRAYSPCPDCQGNRFQPETLLYQLDWPGPVELPASLSSESATPTATRRITLAGFYQLSVARALRLVSSWISDRGGKPSDPLSLVFSEVQSRLRYLDDVGLGYLTLDRPTRSLSGGETERVNLTTCLGTRLVNTLFVLDEPSVGLHPRDTDRLVRVLEGLRDAGNTVVVVEHEAAVMEAADHLIDLGPGQGERGGQIVFQGDFPEILKSRLSLTGQYLSRRKTFDPPANRPVAGGKRQLPQSRSSETQRTDWLTIKGARAHNLKDIDVAIPLRRFVCLTGVSGSGKTTLVRDVLMPALQARLSRSQQIQQEGEEADSVPDTSADEPVISDSVGLLKGLEGCENLDRVILVDQASLGKTPRSNPVVYIGAFEHIRNLFAETDLAKQRGINASGFSFNSGQGQCERCRGAGFEKIEMQFLSDVFVRCPECQGRRYREHILEVKLQPSVTPEEGNRMYSRDLEPALHSRPFELGETLALPPSRGSKRMPTAVTSPQRKNLSKFPVWSIADLLEATVDDVVDFLAAFPGNRHAHRALSSLSLLQEVGLGYLRLGQPINTLSGGECQRLKLVGYLAESAAATGRDGTTDSRRKGAPMLRTLFLFDEPTTGLHFEDIRVLMQVFQKLVDSGHSVLVIEHHLGVIRSADWVIDLGPEAGEQGGQIVIAGTPETVAACPMSHTGRAMQNL